MGAYIIRRILLMIPTIFGIMAVSFLITQFAPGGPVEQALANMSGQNVDLAERVTGGGGETSVQPIGDARKEAGTYRGRQGLSPDLVARIEKQFGFDKPPLERFVTMIGNYLRFDFGESYYRDISVIDLVVEKMPVSISLGLWMTLIAYGVSIPLGIAKARRDGSRFDVWTSTVIIVGYASFPIWRQVLDYFWHLVLPIIAMGLGAFATSTLLTKNSFLDEISKQYVVTARAKGLTENRVLYGHVFRNAMMLIIASFPGAFIGAFFGGSLLIETIFSLDGLGLLGFEAIATRDYPVVFATLYIFSLLGLVIGLISDLAYMWVDPRLDFESRDA
jgi:microcin C transport system permease protein